MEECHKCNALNKEGSKFCINCGSKITAQNFFCTNCGRKISAQSSFCKYCGMQINSALKSKDVSYTAKPEAGSLNIFPASQAASSEKKGPAIPAETKKSRNWKIPVFTVSGIIIFLILSFSALMIASIIKPVNISFLNFSIDAGKFKKNNHEVYDSASSGRLSGDQEKLIQSFGYPDEFITFFDDTDNGARTDTWTYTLLQKSFFFYEGSYKGSSSYIGDENDVSSVFLKPENFSYKMHPLKVNYIMGKNGDEIIDKSNKKRYLLFDDGKEVFIFNSSDYLIGVLKLSKPFYSSDD